MQEHMSAKDYRQIMDIDNIFSDPEYDTEFTRKNVKKSFKKLKKLMSEPTEHDIQKLILERLGFLKNGFFWRENSGLMKIESEGNSRFFRAGIPGIPDVMGVYRGKPVGIEVKRPGKKQSVDQKAFEQRYKQCGGIYIVCMDATQIVSQLEYAILESEKALHVIGS